MMNLTKILELVAPKLDSLQKEHISKIEQEIKKKPNEFDTALSSALVTLCNLVTEEQKKGNKKPIEYIVFSFLYSNLIRDKYALRISAYDSDFWNDENEIFTEWDISLFFQGCKDEFHSAMNTLSSNYIRIEPHEEIELYRGYVMDYYRVAFTYLGTSLPKFQDLVSFQQLEKEAKVLFLLGEYRDKTQKIWEYEEKDGLF